MNQKPIETFRIKLPTGGKATVRILEKDEQIPSGAFAKLNGSISYKYASESSVGQYPRDFANWTFYVRA